MNDQQSLHEMVVSSEGLMLRLIEDFDDELALRQPPGLPNHVRWTLGHCAWTMVRVAADLDGGGLAETDFYEGDGQGEDPQRFDTTVICRGSSPVADDRRYPSLNRSREIYSAACQRFAATVSQLTPQQRGQEIQFHDGPISTIRLVARVCFHSGAHSGQILDLRRALGMPGMIG